MKTPVHLDTRPDELAAQQFEQMLASKSWARYADRVALMARQAAGRCVTECNMIELRKQQGAAEALRAVVLAPIAILAELKRQARK